MQKSKNVGLYIKNIVKRIRSHIWAYVSAQYIYV